MRKLDFLIFFFLKLPLIRTVLVFDWPTHTRTHTSHNTHIYLGMFEFIFLANKMQGTGRPTSTVGGDIEP